MQIKSTPRPIKALYVWLIPTSFSKFSSCHFLIPHQASSRLFTRSSYILEFSLTCCCTCRFQGQGPHALALEGLILSQLLFILHVSAQMPLPQKGLPGHPIKNGFLIPLCSQRNLLFSSSEHFPLFEITLCFNFFSCSWSVFFQKIDTSWEKGLCLSSTMPGTDPGSQQSSGITNSRTVLCWGHKLPMKQPQTISNHYKFTLETRPWLCGSQGPTGHLGGLQVNFCVEYIMY